MASDVFQSILEGSSSTWEIVHRHLSSGFQPNTTDRNGWTLLHLGALRGFAHLTQTLVGHGATVDMETPSGLTALQIASFEGHYEFIRDILPRGADINHSNQDGVQAIHLAAAANKTAIVAYLLTNGADINARTGDGSTPIMVAAQHGASDVLSTLMYDKADTTVTNTRNWSLLHSSAWSRNNKVLEIVLANVEDVDRKTDKNENALHICLQSPTSQIPTVCPSRVVIQNPTINYQDYKNVKNGSNTTGAVIIHQRTTTEEKHDCVRTLTAAGLDVNVQDHYGSTPLLLACTTGCSKAASHLLKYGASANLHSASGMTPLMSAVYGGDTEIVEELLKHRANVDAAQRDGWTALHAAASGSPKAVLDITDNRNYLNILIELIACTDDINKTNTKGQTPLFVAVEKKNKEAAKILLERKSDLNIKNHQGWQPIHQACHLSDSQMVQILLDHGANHEALTNEDQSCLMLACKSESIECVRLLLDKNVDIMLKDKYGNTAYGYTSSDNMVKELNKTKDALKGKDHYIQESAMSQTGMDQSCSSDSCNHINPPEAKFCSTCGTNLRSQETYAEEKLFCPNCGFTLTVDSRFCQGCGTQIPDLNGHATTENLPSGMNAPNSHQQEPSSTGQVGGSLDFTLCLTQDQFLQDVLPHMNRIQKKCGLTTSFMNFPILQSVKFNGKMSGLFEKQCIWFTQFSDTDLCSIVKKAKNVGEWKDGNVGVIVKVLECLYHHVSFYVCSSEKIVWFMDPKGHGIEGYPTLSQKLDVELPHFKVSQLGVPRHNGLNSLAHAYINVRVLMVGHQIHSKNDIKWRQFKSSMPNFAILSENNAEKLPIFLSEQSNEDVLLIAREQQQRKTARILLKTLVTNGKSLNDIKGAFNEMNTYSKLDMLYIEGKFIKYTFQILLDQVSTMIEASAYKLNDSVETFAVTDLHILEKVIGPLRDITAYPLIQDSLDEMEEREKQHYYDRLLSHVQCCLRSATSITDDEADFLEELKRCLIEVFLTGETLSDSPFLSDDTELVLHLLESLHENHSLLSETLQYLREALGDFSLLSTQFQTRLRSLVKDWYNGQKVIIEPSKSFPNRNVLVVDATYLNLALHLPAIESSLEAERHDEVHIVARTCLKINSSLTWCGKNVVVIAQTIFVGEGPYRWDFSGMKADDFKARALGGKIVGSHGQDGMPGQPGESGGNVHLYCKEFLSSQNLFLVSNGGNGGNGQDGGNGKDGMNGVDGNEITIGEFDDQFPRVATSGTLIPGRFDKMRKKYLSNSTIKKERLLDSKKNYYYELQSVEGNDIILGIYQNYFAALLLMIPPFRQSYCIYKGGEGTQGQKGGDGGRGGLAGHGGHAGELGVFTGLLDPILELRKVGMEAMDGLIGQPGKHGTGGSGGRHGKRGRDVGRMESSQWKTTITLQGRLKVVKHSQEKSPGNIPYCAHNEKYIELKVIDPSPTTTAECGVHATTSSIDQQQHYAIRRAPIITSEIRSCYLSRMETSTVLQAYVAEEKSEKSHAADILNKTQKLVVFTEEEVRNISKPFCMPNSKHGSELKQPSLEMRCNNESKADCFTASFKSISDLIKNKRIEHEKSLKKALKSFQFSDVKDAISNKIRPPDLVLSKEDILSMQNWLHDMRTNMVYIYACQLELINKCLNICDFILEQTKQVEASKVGLVEICIDFEKYLIDRLKLAALQMKHSRHADHDLFCNDLRLVLGQTTRREVEDFLEGDMDMESSRGTQYSNQTLQLEKTTVSSSQRKYVEVIIKSVGKNLMKSLVLRILHLRLTCEKCIVNDFFFKMLTMLSLRDENIHHFIARIILLEAQKDWIVGITCKLLTPSEYQENLKIEILQYVSSIPDENVLLTLVERMCNSHSDFTGIDRVIETTHFLCNMSFTAEQLLELSRLDLNDWWWKLMWYNSVILLEQLPVQWVSKDKLIEGSFHMMELANQQGYETACKHLQFITETTQLSQSYVLDSLIARINGVEPGKGLSSKERSLNELGKIMMSDGNNKDIYLNSKKSFELVEEIGELCHKKLLVPTDNKDGQDNTVFKEISLSNISKEELAKYIANNQSSMKNPTNLPITVAIIKRAIFLMKGLELRLNQLLSIVLFLRTEDNGLLQQISTGEGKSLIIVGLSLIIALRRQKVDVITSSPVLARRDAIEYQDIYTMFGITVGNNCSHVVDDRQKAYMADIVYGEIGAFQRDQLLDRFYNKNITGSRGIGCVIVDEVDSMILDKGENMLYLSHTIAGMETLEPAYIWIWNIVNSIPVCSVDSIKDYVHSTLFGALTKEDLSYQLEQYKMNLDAGTIWSQLSASNQINQFGEPLFGWDVNEQNLVDIKVSITEKNKLISILKDTLRKGRLCHCPVHLQGFIKLHLNDWIQSAIKAKYMVEGEHYILDIDRTEANQARNINIVIMDNDTGTEQYNSQWSNGLHQFLQLKHGCSLDYESLKAVFMSNISFFRQYGTLIFGLTGTLGSQSERMMLGKLYSIKFANIPTFRPTRFTEKPADILTSRSEWLNNVVRTSLRVATARPVLIVCDTIMNLELLQKEFPKDAEIRVYKNSYQKLECIQTSKPLDKPLIILSTNLAGRGTDIKISSEIDCAGGLHVILTYLPRNSRVEQQAFGRAARKGQNGSGQMIIFHESGFSQSLEQMNPNKIFQLRLYRDKQEVVTTEEIHQHYEYSLKREEDLFQKFSNGIYQAIKSDLKVADLDKESMDILLSSILDKWAFWLDKISLRSNCKLDLDTMKKDICDPQKCRENWIQYITTPAQKTKLGKHYIRQNKYSKAKAVFEEIIFQDQRFSAGAYYYIGFCLIKLKEGKGIVSSSLESAKMQIIEEVDSLVSHATIIGHLSKHFQSNQHSLTLLEDFQLQKQSTIEIYNQIILSIDLILGLSMTLDCMIQETDDVFLGMQLFYLFRQKNLIMPPQLNQMVLKENKIQSYISRNYQTCHTELTCRLNTMTTNNKPVSARNFTNLLPSREEFWKQLAQKGALSLQANVFIIDMKRVNDMDVQYVWIRNKIKSLNPITLPNSGKHDGQIVFEIKSLKCPSLETVVHQEHFKIVRATEWQNSFQSSVLTALLVKGNFMWQAKFGKVEPSNTYHVRFDHFDSISPDCFTVVGGLKSRAQFIIDFLIEHKIISASKPHSLMISTLQEVPFIPECEAYHTEMLHIIQRAFAFQFAKMELLQTGLINLPSHPEVTVFEDLKHHNIIQDYHLSQNATRENLSSNLKCLSLDCGEDSFRKYLGIISNLTHSGDYISDHIEERIEEYFLVSSSTSISKKVSDALKLIHGDLKAHQPKADQTSIAKYTRELMVKHTQAFTEDQHLIVLVSIISRFHLKSLRECLINKLFENQNYTNKLEHPDAHLSSIVESIDIESQFKYMKELSVFMNNGFDEVIVPLEQKWHWKAICKMAAIAILGVGQICVGILCSFPTAGVSTAFVFEGMNDLFFVLQSMFSGYCSLKDYAKHKAISLLLTVSMVGVTNAIVAGSTALRSAVGTADNLFDLGRSLGTMTKSQVVGEIARRAAPRLAGAIALNAAHRVLDFSSKVQLSRYVYDIQEVAQQNLQDKITTSDLRMLIRHLAKAVGTQETKQTLEYIENGVLKPGLEKISHASAVTECVKRCKLKLKNSIRSAGSQNYAGGTMQSSSSSLSNILKSINAKHDVEEVGDYVKRQALSCVSKIEVTLRRKIQEARSPENVADQHVADENDHQYYDTVINSWEQQLNQALARSLKQHFASIEDVLEHAAVNETCKAMKKSISNCTPRNTQFQQLKERQLEYGRKQKSVATSWMREEVEEISPAVRLDKLYHEALLKSARKQENERLMRDLLTRGIALGEMDAQMVANLTGRRLVLHKQELGTERMETKKYVPRRTVTAETVEIDTKSKFFRRKLDGAQYRCLYQAASIGLLQ